MYSNLTKKKGLTQAPLAAHNPMRTEPTTSFANEDHGMQLKMIEKADFCFKLVGTIPHKQDII